MAPIEPYENDDLLAQATEALRATPIPDEPPADAVEAVLAAAENLKIHPRTPLSRRFQTLRHLIKIAAAFIIVAGLAGVLFLINRGGPSRFDFGRIVETLLAARTATFKVTIDTQGLPQETQEGMYMDPALLRQSRPDMVKIMDLTRGRMLTLAPELKTAILTEIAYPPPNQFTFLEIKEILRQAQQNEAAVTYLSPKQIEGQTAWGYRIKQPLMEITIWADADNLRPIRLESTFIAEGQKRHIAIHDFALDVHLDRALFSLKAPELYAVFYQASPLSAPFNVGTVMEFFDPLRGSLKERKDVQQLPQVMALMMMRRIITL